MRPTKTCRAAIASFTASGRLKQQQQQEQDTNDLKPEGFLQPKPEAYGGIANQPTQLPANLSGLTVNAGRNGE